MAASSQPPSAEHNKKRTTTWPRYGFVSRGGGGCFVSCTVPVSPPALLSPATEWPRRWGMHPCTHTDNICHGTTTTDVDRLSILAGKPDAQTLVQTTTSKPLRLCTRRNDDQPRGWVGGRTRAPGSPWAWVAQSDERRRDSASSQAGSVRLPYGSQVCVQAPSSSGAAKGSRLSRNKGGKWSWWCGGGDAANSGARGWR